MDHLIELIKNKNIYESELHIFKSYGLSLYDDFKKNYDKNKRIMSVVIVIIVILFILNFIFKYSFIITVIVCVYLYFRLSKI